MNHFRLLKRNKWNGEKTPDSGTILADALGIKVWSNRPHSAHKLLINWGVSHNKSGGVIYINGDEKVGQAVNKLTAFRCMASVGVPIPNFTDDKEVASTFIEIGSKVVCRTLLSGSCGEGIVLAKTIDQLVDAPLYVEAIKKIAEYRAHVVREPASTEYNTLIVQKKRLTTESLAARGIVERSTFIRNTANGYIYSEGHNLSYPYELEIQSVATRAIKALGLSFGAVDIIMDEYSKFYVLEVNTAPGLKCTSTLEFYRSHLHKYMEYYRV